MESTDTPTTPAPTPITPLRASKEIEQDLERLSMDVGKQYHEKCMAKARLDQTTGQFNRTLLEYKQAMDHEGKGV